MDSQYLICIFAQMIQACRGDETQGRTTTLSTSKSRDIVEDGAVAKYGLNTIHRL